MAEDVAAELTPGREERARTSGYHFRFSLVYALLAAVAAGSIAALVVVVVRPDAAKAENWSKFKPTGSAIARTRQIATRVSDEYKLQAGQKLATVVPSPLQTTRFLQGDSGPVSVEVPISTVAAQPDVSTGKHARARRRQRKADGTSRCRTRCAWPRDPAR